MIMQQLENLNNIKDKSINGTIRKPEDLSATA